MANKKQENHDMLQQIADVGGDLMLMEMFWSMFDDLSLVKQKGYIEWAKEIVKRETNITV